MVMVEESYLPISLSAPHLTDDEFRELCDKYADYRVEYTGDGELIIMPPTDPETGGRNAAITKRLGNWTDSVRRGLATDSSTGFVLPDGSRRSPDAAWISGARYRQRPRCCPEFVIELVSPFDQRKRVHEKMLEWIGNGAELAWMIDPARKTVTIYRQDGSVEALANLQQVEGEGPVAGFVLDLAEVWDVTPFD